MNSSYLGWEWAVEILKDIVEKSLSLISDPNLKDLSILYFATKIDNFSSNNSIWSYFLWPWKKVHI